MTDKANRDANTLKCSATGTSQPAPHPNTPPHRAPRKHYDEDNCAQNDMATRTGPKRPPPTRPKTRRQRRSPPKPVKNQPRTLNATDSMPLPPAHPGGNATTQTVNARGHLREESTGRSTTALLKYDYATKDMPQEPKKQPLSHVPNRSCQRRAPTPPKRRNRPQPTEGPVETLPETPYGERTGDGYGSPNLRAKVPADA